ncbi:MAG TPA: hypothetical protein VNC16_06850 [Solirubrobacterales bacterium]|nr:hypothetical protein [Solirubrobacterales bacterium]
MFDGLFWNRPGDLGAPPSGDAIVVLAVRSDCHRHPNFGPASGAKLEAREERIDQQIDARDERMKERDDWPEEATEQNGH